MPCYTVQTHTVSLKDADPEILGEALKKVFGEKYVEQMAWGWQARDGRTVIAIRDGQLTASGVYLTAAQTETMAKTINVAVSNIAVQRTALRFGWLAKPMGQNRYQLVKR